MIDIGKEIDRIRLRLLDLSMRNRLLNHVPSKSRSIRIVDEVISEVYDSLVFNEKVMEFASVPESNTQAPDNTTEPNEDDDVERWTLIQPDEISDTQVDRYLQTSLRRIDLTKKLYYIHQQARTVFEEQGYTVLYLALGFLEWYEAPASNQPRRAPLILVPVELDRIKVSQPFKVSWSGDEIYTNISLRETLAAQGVDLPEFRMPEDKAGIDAYLTSVATAVSPMSKWRVMADLYLDFFSFKKFVMYKDLDQQSWPQGRKPSEHTLIKSILEPGSVEHHYDGIAEEEIDDKVDYEKSYHVMDADPSQIVTIEGVKGGHNIVVQGPPGTGKSQTITNIIAESLGTGKSVLFVSEKMAALEVVKTRLDTVGLGDFCLEIHSRKTNKKEFLKELERTINSSNPAKSHPGETFNRLSQLRRELNEFATMIRKPVGTFQVSPHELFCRIEKSRRHFLKSQRKLPVVEYSNPLECSPTSYQSALVILNELSQVMAMVMPIRNHPWNGCNPGLILPSSENEIESLIEQGLGSLETVFEGMGKLFNIAGISRCDNFEQLTPRIQAAQLIANSDCVKTIDIGCSAWRTASTQAKSLIDTLKQFQSEWSSLHLIFNETAFAEDIDSIYAQFSMFVSNYAKYAALWRERRQSANELISKLERYQAIYATLNNLFVSGTLDIDPSDLLTEFRALSKLRFKIFSSKYRLLKKKINSLYRGRVPFHCASIEAHLVSWMDLYLLRNDLRSTESSSKTLFGSNWIMEKSDPAFLKQYIKDLEIFSSDLSTTYPMGAIPDLSHVDMPRSMLEEMLHRVRSLYSSTEHIKGVNSILSNLKRMMWIRQEQTKLDSLSQQAKQYFADAWKGQDSNVEQLGQIFEWIAQFYDWHKKQVITDKTIGLFKNGIPTDQLQSIIDNVQASRKQFLSQWNDLVPKVQYQPTGYKEGYVSTLPFDAILQILQKWKAGGW